MPVVFVLARRTSDSVGVYRESAIRRTESKKLFARSVKIGQPDDPAHRDILWCRVHEIELAGMLHQLGHARVVPQREHCFADTRLQHGRWVRIDLIREEVLHMIRCCRILRLYFELLHGGDEIFGAIDEIPVDGDSIHGKLVFAVSALMNDLHLLDDGRFSALSRACQIDDQLPELLVARD